MAEPSSTAALIDSTLTELFRHNRWANIRLLEACRGLSPQQLEGSAIGTYGSIRDTLRHIVAAEERYLSLLTGTPVENPLPPGIFPGVEELLRRSRRSGEALAGLAAQVRPAEEIRTTSAGKESTEQAATVLIQAINHATEHRGQVATVMTQHGITPPVIDGWAYAERTP